MTGITYDRVDYVRRISINRDESLQEFALRTTGDAANWVDIANLNNLLPPYVTADIGTAASGRVALYGTYLRVPGTVPFVEYHDDEDLMFERDLALGDAGTLDVESGDIKLVSGIQNLHQALLIRVTTSPGELIFHPRYGCGVRRLLGAASGQLAVIAAGAYVQGAVEADPRIERVTNLSSSMDGDALRVECECVPIFGPPRTVPLVI